MSGFFICAWSYLPLYSNNLDMLPRAVFLGVRTFIPFQGLLGSSSHKMHAPEALRIQKSIQSQVN
jgi:hypothetical protein